MARMPVQIGDYDLLFELEGFQWTTIKSLKAQQDEAARTGEGALSSEDLWRRSITDFSGGAGQIEGDTIASSPVRFTRSQGFEIENGFLRATPETVLKEGFTDPEHAVYLDTTLYVASGDTIYQASVNESTGAVTDDGNDAVGAGTDIEDLVVVGPAVYAVVGANGVYDVTDYSATSKINDLSAVKGWWVLGRFVLADSAGDLYNITDVGTTTAPTAFHEPVFATTWNDAAGLGGYIYLCGTSGDQSIVSKITLEEDGTALGFPSTAMTLPNGETPNKLYSYGGLMFIGTSQGLRVATQNESTGNLTYGPLLNIGSVNDMVASGSRLYVATTGGGQTYYKGGYRVTHDPALYDVYLDGVSEEPLRPPYTMRFEFPDSGTSKGMFTDSTGVSWYVLDSTVSYEGVWRIGNQAYGSFNYESEERWVETSTYDFGVPHKKAFEALEIVADPQAGDATATVYIDDGRGTGTAFGDFDTSGDAAAGLSSDPVQNMTMGVVGNEVYVRVTWASQQTMKLQSLSIRAVPMIDSGAQIVLPLVLRTEVEDRNGQMVRIDPKEVHEYLLGLNGGSRQVDVTLFGTTHRCVVDQVSLGDNLDYTPNMDYVEGVCYVSLKTWQEV